VEHEAGHWELEIGNLVVLVTKLNPKTGEIGFSPNFPSFDHHVNPECEYSWEDWEKSIRVFRPMNNGFTLEKEGEEWLAKVIRIEVDKREKRTKDNRTYVYIYVEILRRKEQVIREFLEAKNTFVEEIRSGTVIISRKEIGELMIEEEYFQSDSFVFRGRVIYSPEGELLLVKVLDTEAKDDYLARVVAQMQGSPFARALGKFGTPEEAAAREIASLRELPPPEMVRGGS